jgi:CBS domain containing-hemolysin-like protein
MDELKAMEKTYRKLMLSGLSLLLVAFALLIFKPFGRASLFLGLVIFPVSLIPLELARRTAHRIALMILSRSDGKA